MTPLSLLHNNTNTGVALCNNIGLVLLIIGLAMLFCHPSYCTMCIIYPDLFSFVITTYTKSIVGIEYVLYKQVYISSPTNVHGNML